MKKFISVKTVQQVLIKAALNLKGPELGTNKWFRPILTKETSPIPFNLQLTIKTRIQQYKKHPI